MIKAAILKVCHLPPVTSRRVGEDPTAMTRAIVGIIHQGLTVDEALKILGENG